MKLLGWTIVASGLILGLAACTVTSDDPAADGGTGGTGGSGGAATGGVAGSAAGAAGSTAGAAGSVAGAAGAGGAAACVPADKTDKCDVCMNEKCCTEKNACNDDKGNPPQWTSKCGDLWEAAVTCASTPDADGGEPPTFADCLLKLNTDYNQPANDLSDCMYVDKCKTDCQ